MAATRDNQNVDSLKDAEDTAIIKVHCVVKGYQECKFNVNTGEEFFALRKHGSRGRAFRVCNGRGQLGHLQRELVTPLWAVRNSAIKCEVSGEPFDDPSGRWKAGGGINVPVQLTIEMSRHKVVEIKRALRELSFHAEPH